MDEVRVTGGRAFETGGDVETDLIVESRGSAVVGGSVLGRLTAVGTAVVGNDVAGDATAGEA